MLVKSPRSPVEPEEWRVLEADARPAGGPGVYIRCGAAGAEAVVLVSALGVAEDLIGGVCFLEALLGGLVVGIAIGVVLLRQPAVGLFDLLLGRVAADAEDLVRVLAIGHAYSAQPAATEPRVYGRRASRCAASPAKVVSGYFSRISR